MMEAVRQWILSVVVISMLVTLAQTLVPKGVFANVGNFIGGLLLLLTLLTPLSKAGGWELPQNWDSYQAQIQTQQEILTQSQQQILEDGIAELTQAYILDKAQTLGIGCQVEVVTAVDDGGTPMPVAVIFDIPWQEDLSLYVEQTLGIGQEGQTWHEYQ